MENFFINYLFDCDINNLFSNVSMREITDYNILIKIKEKQKYLLCCSITPWKIVRMGLILLEWE